MAIITREHFKSTIQGATLTDAEIETRINNAIEHAMASASGLSTIYVDVGPSWPGRTPSPTAKRAMQLAGDAGWNVDIDGRAGHLILDPK